MGNKSTEYVKRWNLRNPEKARAHNRTRRAAWKKDHPGYNAEYLRRRKLFLRYGVLGAHTPEQWEAVKMLHGNRCLACNRKAPEVTITRDHVIALGTGGTDDISNIQPLCAGCNKRKGKRTRDFRVGA